MMTNEQVLHKMEEDFLLRGSSQKTRRTYRTALIRFSAFAAKDRYSDLNEKDLRSFLLHLHQQGKLQGTSINTYNAGCKFFLEVVLGLAINRKQVPNVRARHKQPVHFRVEQLRAVLCPSQRDQGLRLLPHPVWDRDEDIRAGKAEVHGYRDRQGFRLEVPEDTPGEEEQGTAGHIAGRLLPSAAPLLAAI